MPQQRHIFEVELPNGEILEIDAPETTSPDAIKDRARTYMLQQLGTTMHPKPELQETSTNIGGSNLGMVSGALDAMTPYLPDTRTAMRGVGGGFGGAAGAAIGGPPGAILGATAGTMIGDMGYQLGRRMMDPSQPFSAGEQIEAGKEGLLGGALPVAAKFHAEHPIRQAVSSRLQQLARPPFFSSPQATFTRGVGPRDPNFQEYIDDAFSELKAAEAGGARVHDVKSARAAVSRRVSENNNIMKKIVDPQRGIKVPGSRRVMNQAQVDAIPEDIRINDSAKYERMVDDINSKTDDLTIGELNDLRSELGKTQSAFYGKDTSGQLTMDAGTRAMDIARGRASRELFYNALEDYGLGGKEAARTINKRLGSLIHMDDELFVLGNKSVAQQEPLGIKAIRTAKNVVSTANPFHGSIPRQGVDDAIRTSMARWRKTPTPVNINLRAMPQDLGGRYPGRLLPPAKPQLPETGVLHPDDVSQVTGMSAGPLPPGTAQSRTGRLLESGLPLPPAEDFPSGGALMTTGTTPYPRTGISGAEVTQAPQTIYARQIGYQPPAPPETVLETVKRLRGRLKKK